MSKKWILEVYPLATNVDLSANFTTAIPINVKRLDRFIVEITTSGAPVGTLTLQTTADYNYITPSASTWIDLPIAFQPLAGVANNYFVDMYSSGLFWLRLNYVAGAGTGTMNAVIAAKES